MHHLMFSIVSILLGIAFIYLARTEIKNIKHLQRAYQVTCHSRRIFLGRSLMAIAVIGFLASFVLNILIYMQFFQFHVLTGNNTAMASFLFITIYLIAKFILLPKHLKLEDAKNI